MEITAVYPGTFDPITNGHRQVVERAAMLFHEIIFAIAGSTSKETLFSVEERIELAKAALGDLPNVKVCAFYKLVTDLAREHRAKVIIRGLRAVSDFDYEFQMAGMNRQLYPEAETVFLTPGENQACLSSSLVREIATLGGDVSPFVHPEVLKALKKRLG